MWKAVIPELCSFLNNDSFPLSPKLLSPEFCLEGGRGQRDPPTHTYCSVTAGVFGEAMSFRVGKPCSPLISKLLTLPSISCFRQSHPRSPPCPPPPPRPGPVCDQTKKGCGVSLLSTKDPFLRSYVFLPLAPPPLICPSLPCSEPSRGYLSQAPLPSGFWSGCWEAPPRIREGSWATAGLPRSPALPALRAGR